MKKTVWYLLALYIFPVWYTLGQNANVFVQLENDSLYIGEQTILTLRVSSDNKSNIVFPVFKDTLTAQVEVIDIGGVDSIPTQNGVDYIRKTIITAFDTGTFTIPSFRFLIQNQQDVDSLFTSPIKIYYQDAVVDTSQAAKAIKTVKDIPKPPGDYSWLWWLLLLIPIAAFLYYWFKIRKPKPKKVLVETTPAIPAHEKALSNLQKLELEKLWQKGSHKQYHSRLSEIVRTYLEERYKIPALEQTSAEILTMLRGSKLVQNENYEALMQLLNLADMVKFARYIPIGSENEISSNNAKSFVEQTMPVIQNSTNKHEGNSI
jgi:hypothetical protein